jgi:general secretion pathway protein N
MTRAGEKMLTNILAGACGVLFLIGLAMQFGVGRGYHWLDAEDTAAGGTQAALAIDDKPFQLPPQSDFVAINERPLFNEDRRPTKDEVAETTPDGPPPSPLNISLTGTLLAGKPAVRMAMVRENGKANTIALKEGMPLPGDQGAWTLSQVKNRSAIFKSSTGEEVEVELAMVTASPKPGPQSRPAAPGSPPPQPAGAKPGAAAGAPVTAQSEELQRRIEERRKQMREAAERMKNQQQTGQQPQPGQPQQQ